MRLLMRTFNTNEYSDVSLAVVDINKEYAETLFSRAVLLRLAHDKDGNTEEIVYRDGSCEFYGDFLYQEGVDWGDTDALLTEEQRDKFDNDGWIEFPENLKVPDESLRTDVDRCHLLRTYEGRMYVYWSCSPKHGSEHVTSQEIPINVLEGLLTKE